MDADINGVLINTVHDSIVLDLLNKYEAEIVSDIMNSVLEDFPSNFERIFGVPFDLKIHGEITVGNNMYDMVELQ